MFIITAEPTSLLCDTICTVKLRIVNHDYLTCTNVNFELEYPPTVTIFHRRDIHFDYFPPHTETPRSLTMKATTTGDFQLSIKHLSYRDGTGRTQRQADSKLMFNVLPKPRQSENHRPEQPRPEPPRPPIRTILILAANPQDLPTLRLNQEMRDIEECLRRSERRDMFHVKFAVAVRDSDFRRALLDNKPHLVHFLGHGAGKQGIALEDDAGFTQLVTSEALADLFRLFPTIECVILSACYATAQAHAIVRHIPFVVGINGVLSDDAAREFSAAFYDGLGAGRSLEDAFAMGCAGIHMAGLPEYLQPQLLKKFP